MLDKDTINVCIKSPLPGFLSQWASRVGIRLKTGQDCNYELEYCHERLQLNWCGAEKFLPVYVDAPKSGRVSSSNLLLRAVGRHAHSVADLTAGFGVDAFTLAAYGKRVYCIERNPVIAMMLFDGLRRCPVCIRKMVTLEFSDSINWLDKTPFDIDTIYMDTMFSGKKKMAKPPRQMQILRQIVGKDTDAGLLFSGAVKKGAGRIVVKSADNGPLMDYPLNAQFKGKTVRFDIYLPEYSR